MYQRLYESSDDKTVKEMVVAHLMRLDSLDDRDVIRHAALDEYPNARPVVVQHRGARLGSHFFRGTPLRIDPATGTPLDPSGAALSLNRWTDVTSISVKARRWRAENYASR